MAIPCKSRLRERGSRDWLRLPAAGGKPEYVVEATALGWLDNDMPIAEADEFCEALQDLGTAGDLWARYPREGQG